MIDACEPFYALSQIVKNEGCGDRTTDQKTGLSHSNSDPIITLVPRLVDGPGDEAVLPFASSFSAFFFSFPVIRYDMQLCNYVCYYMQSFPMYLKMIF